MCGICGFTGMPDNRDDVIKRMTEVITHRGPDSDGFYCDDAVSMGFRRLSIIDLEAGRQPIFNEDKSLVLTFNGEIYNYKQLREELVAKGHTFATKTDSEVLVHGFEEWKEDLLPRLRGMFAFAIYNTKDKSLFLARDFFGIKPLHYTMIGNDFVYASEIKSILEHPQFEKRFNMRALDTYLSFQYALPPETFFEEVYCLLPGHYLWFTNGAVETTRYFEPRFKPDENMTEDEAVDKIEKVFENSVNAHKIADVEVGCFLSSGVDSSYVSTYFADQKTFTVGFDFGEKYNEISWAENLSKLIGVEHHTHLISSEEFWDAVPTVQYYMDQPLADPSCVALYFVSRLASQYVKVVLSGEGADELFGGYTCYNDPRVFRLYQKIVPHFLRRALRAIARKLPDIKGRDYVIRACDKLEERYIGNAFMYDRKQKQKILKNPAIATAPQRYARRHYYRCRRYDDVTKMQYLDINLWMTGDILLKADRMSMANSLELRVPFLDKEVFKVASSLPTSLRVNKHNTKYALRKAAARHMPETTAEKEKLGFPVPTRVWLRDEKFYNIVKEKFQGETAEKFFNTDALVKWLDEHFSGKEDNSRRVWTVYVFLVWYDIYFNDKQTRVEKPEEHLDELKALAEAKREQLKNAQNEAAEGAESPAPAEAAENPDADGEAPVAAAAAATAEVVPPADNEDFYGMEATDIDDGDYFDEPLTDNGGEEAAAEADDDAFFEEPLPGDEAEEYFEEEVSEADDGAFFEEPLPGDEAEEYFEEEAPEADDGAFFEEPLPGDEAEEYFEEEAPEADDGAFYEEPLPEDGIEEPDEEAAPEAESDAENGEEADGDAAPAEEEAFDEEEEEDEEEDEDDDILEIDDLISYFDEPDDEAAEFIDRPLLEDDFDYDSLERPFAAPVSDPEVIEAESAVRERAYEAAPETAYEGAPEAVQETAPAVEEAEPSEQPAEPAPAPEPTYVDIDESFGEEEETFINIDNPNDTAIYRINRKDSGKK